MGFSTLEWGKNIEGGGARRLERFRGSFWPLRAKRDVGFRVLGRFFKTLAADEMMACINIFGSCK